MPILGSVTRDEEGGGERRLAERILRTGAGAVYVHGLVGTDLGRLRAALGPDVAIICSSRALPIANLFDNAGGAARGIYVTIGELPPEALGAAGERFARDFGGPLPGDFVPRWAYYGAAAAEVMLDAIARSDGTRESVASALARTRDVATPLGPISLDPLGERTTHPVAILRAERREQPLEPGGMQGAALAEVIDPPARLVGGAARAARGRLGTAPGQRAPARRAEERLLVERGVDSRQPELRGERHEAERVQAAQHRPERAPASVESSRHALAVAFHATRARQRSSPVAAASSSFRARKRASPSSGVRSLALGTMSTCLLRLPPCSRFASLRMRARGRSRASPPRFRPPKLAGPENDARPNRT